MAPPALLPPIAAAPTCTVDEGCRHVNAATLFTLAERLAQDGNVSAATRMLATLQQDSDITIRSEASFRLAGLLEQQGDFADAIVQYRAILAEQPALGSVRLALARALARAGSDRQALSELRHALATGLPNQVAQAVDRLTTALRSVRRVGAVVEVGVAPDSNISHATARNTVTIGSLDFLLTPDARQRSGIGGYGQAQSYWRPKVAPNLNLLTTVSGTASLYGASNFDDVAGTVTFGPELVRSRSRLQLAAHFGQRWFGGHFYSRSYGGNLSALFLVGQRTQLQATGQIAQVRYTAIDAQTGLQAGGSISIERQLSSRLVTRVTIQAEHEDARTAAFTTWTYGGSVLLSRTFGRILLFVTGSRFAIDGAGPFAFPAAQRHDALWQAQGGVQFPSMLYGQIQPMVRIRYSSNTSPVFFYQYEEVRCELGLVHDF